MWQNISFFNFYKFIKVCCILFSLHIQNFLTSLHNKRCAHCLKNYLKYHVWIMLKKTLVTKIMYILSRNGRNLLQLVLAVFQYILQIMVFPKSLLWVELCLNNNRELYTATDTCNTSFFATNTVSNWWGNIYLFIGYTLNPQQWETMTQVNAGLTPKMCLSTTIVR